MKPEVERYFMVGIYHWKDFNIHQGTSIFTKSTLTVNPTEYVRVGEYKGQELYERGIAPNTPERSLEATVEYVLDITPRRNRSGSIARRFLDGKMCFINGEDYDCVGHYKGSLLYERTVTRK